MKSFRHLSKQDILQICSILDNWSLPTLSWEALCREVEVHLKHRYSRQALERKVEIKEHFQAKRERPSKLVPADESEKKIAKLKTRIDELEAALAAYDVRFLRHVERAIAWSQSPDGLAGKWRPEDLEAPMEKEIPMLRSE
jgi:pyruvate/oxaloacetate carboxyltransferase